MHILYHRNNRAVKRATSSSIADIQHIDFRISKSKFTLTFGLILSSAERGILYHTFRRAVNRPKPTFQIFFSIVLFLYSKTGPILFWGRSSLAIHSAS